VAYRMLGSLSEAEDAVQEAWLRLSRSETAAVENLGGWLTTAVSRVCLDMLRSRKSWREEPTGAQVAEPVFARFDRRVLGEPLTNSRRVTRETAGSRHR
jgi:DNA-directed RNA polymerase specialized sigma24 family protein